MISKYFFRRVALISRSFIFQQRASLSPFCSAFSKHHFQSSTILGKKGKAKTSGKKNKKEDFSDSEDNLDTPKVEIDFTESEKRFQDVLEKFTKVANEAKLGRTSPTIFDKLKVNTEGGEIPFTSVAQTSLKGRNFIVTVFDPKYTKSIVNAVLGSDLNMNPQSDPSNSQSLKVPLPPVTTESKNSLLKKLKEEYEKYRNGHKQVSSLAQVRTDVRHKVQKGLKKKKLSDEEEKLLQEFEKMHKTYLEKLLDIYKAAEKAIMK